MNFATFFSYVFLTAFTPGPNTILSMSNAGKYGFKRSFPFNIGVTIGFFIMMVCCAAGSSLLYRFIPSIKPVMLCLGAAYLFWLAWNVWRDRPHKERKEGGSQNSLLISGMALQFVNVKVILYGLTAMSTFILPHYHSFGSIAGFVLILTAVGFAGTFCWALFGAAFERFFQKYGKILNAIMALLLVYCGVMMLLDIGR